MEGRSKPVPRWLAFPVSAANSQKLDKGLEEIFGFDLGSGDVDPLAQRVLYDHFFAAGAYRAQETEQQLNIEQPLRKKGLLKQALDRGTDSEKFRTTLGIVNGEPEGL